MSYKTQSRQNVKPMRDKKVIQRVKDAMRAEGIEIVEIIDVIDQRERY